VILLKIPETQMRRFILAIVILLTTFPPAFADVPAETAQKLLDKVTPSLVAVQVTWEYEYGKFELVGPGIVVSNDGQIMMIVGVVAPSIPDQQLKEFKIIIPGGDKDDEEIDATFCGRDERANLAYVKANESRSWTPIKFEDVALKPGETVLSVGMLPKGAGYKTYFQSGAISTKLRGEIPTYLVTSGALTAVGSPVFNLDGKAVGFVNLQQGRPYLLHTSGGAGRRMGRRGGASAPDDEDPLASITQPPNLFVPSSDFLFSLADPPKPGEPIKLSWMGIPNLTGLNKDVAEAFGLKDQPAIEIGDVVPDAPAAKAGLKTGMKIVKVNGKPLERGDEPDELPAIMTRKLMRMKPGEKVTMSVLTEPGQPLKDIEVTLGTRPKRSNQADRFYADDLGFSAREMVWEDTYVRKLPSDFKGLVVNVIKPQSPAMTAKLEPNDVITQFNSAPITDLASFEKDYKAYRQDKPKDAIVLVVLRSDQSTQTIRIEPPQQ
jgi:serine protease Do